MLKAALICQRRNCRCLIVISCCVNIGWVEMLLLWTHSWSACSVWFQSESRRGRAQRWLPHLVSGIHERASGVCRGSETGCKPEARLVRWRSIPATFTLTGPFSGHLFFADLLIGKQANVSRSLNIPNGVGEQLLIVMVLLYSAELSAVLCWHLLILC